MLSQDKALGYFDSTARLNLILLTARFQFSQTHAEADSRKLVDAVVNIVENTINLDDNGDCVHLIHVQVLFKVLQIVSNVDTEVNVVLF